MSFARKLSHEELQARQADRKPFLPFTVVLNNIRSLYNVGSIFRTADGAGVEKIWMCGITGIPPDNQISKTALGAENEVPWEYAEDAKTCVEKMRAEGYKIVLLEQTHESIPYDQFEPEGKICLVLGNEIRGVSESLLPYSDHSIEIEMAGLKNSLNVSVAFGVVAYHLRACMKKKAGVR